MDNKKEIKNGLLTIALIVAAIVTIATCAGVWFDFPATFNKVCAAILFVLNGGIIAYIGIKNYKSTK